MSNSKGQRCLMHQCGECKMKTYVVTASYKVVCTVEIEAENDDQAWRIAKDMDGGDFYRTGESDWVVESVEAEQ
jgi:hypothetical protein